MLDGTPNEFTTFNGVAVPVKDQLLWYPFWGSERTFPHFAAPWAWTMDTPFKWVKQVPSHFGGTAQGVVMSWPGHINDVGGIRRQFHHVIDIVPTVLEAAGISQPDTVNGIKQIPDRRREHGVHLGKGECEHAFHSQDAIFRDAGQSRHLSGWLGRLHDSRDAAVGAEHQGATGRDHRVQLGALQRRRRSHPIRGSRFEDAGQSSNSCRTSSTPKRRSTTYFRSTIRRSPAGTRRARASRPDARSLPTPVN